MKTTKCTKVQNVYENKPKILTFNGDILMLAPCYSSYDTVIHMYELSEKVWMVSKMHIKIEMCDLYIYLIHFIPQWRS